MPSVFLQATACQKFNVSNVRNKHVNYMFKKFPLIRKNGTTVGVDIHAIQQKLKSHTFFITVFPGFILSLLTVTSFIFNGKLYKEPDQIIQKTRNTYKTFNI